MEVLEMGEVDLQYFMFYLDLFKKVIGLVGEIIIFYSDRLLEVLREVVEFVDFYLVFV